MAQVVGADLLVLAGLRLALRHEAMTLDRTREQRFDERLATTVIPQDMPQELSTEFAGMLSRDSRDRMFDRLDERNLGDR